MFDYFYLIFAIPALLLGIWAQLQVNNNVDKYSKIESIRGMTGAEVAEFILNQNGIFDVDVRNVHGRLNDCYSPNDKAIKLSDGVYDSASISAIGIAAHEAGHAVQHAEGYIPIKIREFIIPVTQFGSWLYAPIIILGIILGSTLFVNLGIVLFSSITLFQLVTLKVEFDASNRAIRTLEESGILYNDEIKGAKKVLKAAALTYVAALVASLLQLLRICLRMMIIFGRRRR